MDVLSYQKALKSKKAMQVMIDRLGMEGTESGASDVKGTFATVRERIKALEDSRVGLRNKIAVIDTDAEWNSGTHQDSVSIGGTLKIAKQDLVPDMTSNNAPSGIAGASTEHTNGHYAWHAFDKEVGSAWISNTNVFPHWLAYNFGVNKTIREYTVQAQWDSWGPTRAPKDWVLQGFDGVNWINLHTASGQTGWASSEVRKFVLGTPASYAHYRLLINSNNGDYLTAINAFELIGEKANAVWEGTLNLGKDSIELRTITLSGTGLENTKVLTDTGLGYVELLVGGEIASNFAEVIKVKVELTNGAAMPEVDKLELHYKIEPFINRVSELEKNTAVNLNKHNLHMNTVVNKNRFGLRELAFDDFRDETGIDKLLSKNVLFDSASKLFKMSDTTLSSELVTTAEKVETVPTMITISQASNAKSTSLTKVDITAGLHASTENNGNLKLSVESKQDLGKTKDLMPTMASNTSPSPFVITESSFLSSREGYKAFNKAIVDEFDAWMANGITGWMQIDVGVAGEIVKEYSLTNINSTALSDRMPKDFTFEASGDALNWTILDTRTAITTWGAGEVRVFPVSNTKAYRYYRINVTANNGNPSYMIIGEMQLKVVELSPLYFPEGTYESPVLNLGDNFKSFINLFSDISYPTPLAFKSNVMPIMSGYTSGSVKVSASSEYNLTNYNAWRAFNHSNADANAWITANGVTTGWLQVDFGSGNEKAISQFAVTTRNASDAPNSAPQDFALYGSNDGTNWKKIHSLTAEINWTINQRRVYPFGNGDKYRFYKLDITKGSGGSYTAVGELELMEADGKPATVAIQTSTSTDGIAFTNFTPINADGTIASPSGKFVKVKINFTALKEIIANALTIASYDSTKVEVSNNGYALSSLSRVLKRILDIHYIASYDANAIELNGKTYSLANATIVLKRILNLHNVISYDSAMVSEATGDYVFKNAHVIRKKLLDIDASTYDANLATSLFDGTIVYKNNTIILKRHLDVDTSSYDSTKVNPVNSHLLLKGTY